MPFNVPVDIAEKILVGPGITGIRNAFPSMTLALGYVDSLGVSEGPAFDKKFLFDVAQGDFHESNLIIPDWSWVSGKGIDATRFIQTDAAEDPDFTFLMQFGLSGISRAGFVGVGVEGAMNIWHRDNAAVYALLQESYAITGGETLFLSRGVSSPITVTFQAGDVDAQDCADRINGTAGMSASGVIARAWFGYLIIGSDGPSITEVHVGSGGTANTIFGWPTTGIDGENPIDFDEFRAIKDVALALGGTAPGEGSFCFVDDDLSQVFVLRHEEMNLLNTQANGRGYLYQGGVHDIYNSQILSAGPAILCQENELVPGNNNWLSLYDCKLQDDWPKTQGGECIQFENGLGRDTAYDVFSYIKTVTLPKVSLPCAIQVPPNCVVMVVALLIVDTNRSPTAYLSSRN